MSIITLTSDWGLKDHYLAVVKASIFSQLSDVNIVDISHLIPHYDIAQAAFIVKNAYPYFPKGSIHIIGLNTVASIGVAEALSIYIFSIGAKVLIGKFNFLFDFNTVIV